MDRLDDLERMLMTACPKKDLEGRLRRSGPSAPATFPCGPASAASVRDSWRVVAADGSSALFRPPPQSGVGCDPRPASGRPSVRMPAPCPALEELVLAADRTGFAQVEDWDRLVGSPAAEAHPAARSGIGPRGPAPDDQLRQVAAVWPRLPQGIREAILAVIRVASR